MCKGETLYCSSSGLYKSLTKRGKTLSMIRPQQQTIGVPIKTMKARDVEMSLKKHFGDKWDDEEGTEYYKLVLSKATVDNTTEDGEEFPESCEPRHESHNIEPSAL